MTLFERRPGAPPPADPGARDRGAPRGATPAPRLQVRDRGWLARAGRLGVLRSLEGRRYMLAGLFSMDQDDLAWLIAQAGGACPQGASLPDVDILVAGELHSSDLVGQAIDEGVLVINEADLVASLVPTPTELETRLIELGLAPLTKLEQTQSELDRSQQPD